MFCIYYNVYILFTLIILLTYVLRNMNGSLNREFYIALEKFEKQFNTKSQCKCNSFFTIKNPAMYFEIITIMEHNSSEVLNH